MQHLTIINMLLTNGPYVPSLFTFILIILTIPNQPCFQSQLRQPRWATLSLQLWSKEAEEEGDNAGRHQ